jgi:hypothetical protein
MSATKRGYLQNFKGLYLGCSPVPVPGKTGDDQFPCYQDRPVGAGWERTLVTDLGGGQVDVLFEDSQREMTLTPDGGLQTRAKGAIGGWEKFFATQQPDGSMLIYRFEGSKLVGVFLFTEVK